MGAAAVLAVLATPVFGVAGPRSEDLRDAIERPGEIVFEGDSRLYVIDASGGRPTKIPGTRPGDGNPVWSPNGRQLSFERERDDHWDVYVMNADGTNQRQLTFSPGDDDYARWAPHGRSLAFQSTRDVALHVYVINVKSGAARRVAHGEYPDWTSDSRIMFTSGGRLLTVRPYGAERRPLRKQPPEIVISAMVSSDGKKIVYGHDGGLSVALVDGSQSRRLTSTPQDDDAVWSPDDKWVAFDRGYSDIYVIRANGTGQTRLTSSGNVCCPDWGADQP